MDCRCYVKSDIRGVLSCCAYHYIIVCWLGGSCHIILLISREPLYGMLRVSLLRATNE